MRAWCRSSWWCWLRRSLLDLRWLGRQRRLAFSITIAGGSMCRLASLGLRRNHAAVGRSSDPDEVRRHKLRWKFEERIVLTSAVCRELMATARGSGYSRSEAALALLGAWMRGQLRLTA